MPKSFKKELHETIESAQSDMACVWLHLTSHPEKDLEPDQIKMFQQRLKSISGHCQEALEKISLYNGDKKVAEHQCRTHA
jgi:hypothetical protein